MLRLIVQGDIIVERRINRPGAQTVWDSKDDQHPESMEKENPNSAITVRKTLTTVTILVSYFRVSLSEKRLETIVPPEIIIDTIPI